MSVYELTRSRVLGHSVSLRIAADAVDRIERCVTIEEILALE